MEEFLIPLLPYITSGWYLSSQALNSILRLVSPRVLKELTFKCNAVKPHMISICPAAWIFCNWFMMKKTYKHIILTGAILEVTGDTIAETLKGGRYYPVAFFTICLWNLRQWVTSFQKKEWKVPCRTGELLPKSPHDYLAPEPLAALPAKLLAEQATDPDASAGKENDPSFDIWVLLQL